MREILFRGKSLDNGELVEGWFEMYPFAARLPLKAAIIPLEKAKDGCYEHVQVDPATVGQYTGLKDKHGQRIFDGDIVTGLSLFGMPINAVVKFRDGAFWLEWYRGEIMEFSAFTSICNVTYDVIGNINDNPELLEGGDE